MTPVSDVYNSLAKRDHKDSTRKAAPLQIALGAIVIDSTDMQAEQVVEMITHAVREAGMKA